MAAANGVPSAASSLTDENDGAHIGDSICTDCYGVGNSKIERRSIPGFRDIIVSVFQCEDCGRSAEEVQLAGQFGEQGVRLRLAVPLGCAATLGRQVLKSDTASCSIPELEFEIGAGAYVPFAGDLTTVGQVLKQACKNLNMNQEERRAADAETASKIDEFISELEGYAAGSHAFTFEVEDVAGNSFIGGPAGGGAGSGGDDGDTQLVVEHFARTAAQESRMGLAMPHEFLEEGHQAVGGDEPAAAAAASAPGRLILRVEGLQEAAAFMESYAAPAGPVVQSLTAAAAAAGVEVPTSCAACGSGMDGGFVVGVHRPVPAFISGCLIVRTACNTCSAAAAEVRSTGGVAARGSRIRLRVETPADLQRAVLQSASASISLPELELALSTGSNAGMVTTVGQLVSNLSQQLGSNAALQPGAGGAEGAEAEQAEWSEFLASLRAFAALERPWTLELTDPLDSSFVGRAAAAGEGEADARLTIVRFERAPGENQHFGLAAGGGAAEVA